MKNIYLHIAISLVLLAVLIGLISVVKNWFEGDTEEATEDRFKELKKAGGSLSYPLNQYADWADQIQEALAQGSDLEDDEEVAIQILSDYMNNELDVLQLIRAYGKRKDISFGFSVGDKRLPTLIKDELDPSEIAEINQLYLSQSINYKF